MKIKNLLSKRFFETQKIYNKLHKKKYSLFFRGLLVNLALLLISVIPLIFFVSNMDIEVYQQNRSFYSFIFLLVMLAPSFMCVTFMFIGRKLINKNKERKQKIRLYGLLSDYYSQVISRIKKANFEELLEVEDIILNKISHLPQEKQQEILEVYEQQLDYYQNKKSNIQNKIKKHKKQSIIKEI